MDIYVKGLLTRQDIQKVFFRHLKPAHNSIVTRLILLGLVVLVVIFTVAGKNPSLWIFLLSALVVIGVISPWWMPYFQALTYNKNSPLFKPLTGLVNDDGINLHGVRFESNMKWTSFSYYKKTKDVILLYQDPNAFNFLTRKLFRSDAEWEGCVTTVQKYLQPLP